MGVVLGIIIVVFSLVFLITVPQRLDRIADALESIAESLGDEEYSDDE